MPENDVHSNLGASSSHRWMNCPGSVRLYEQLPERHATEYAATGTVAHSLCEEALVHNCDPAVHVGCVYTQDGFEVRVTESMVEAVAVYVNFVRSECAKHGGELFVERYFSLDWLHPGMFGRNDACIVPSGLFGTLRVFDYKNGRKHVDAEWNPQLMYYALGALGERNMWFVEEVEMTIVQPNAIGKKAIDTWTISVSDLYKWAREVLLPAALATEKQDAAFCMGEWCAFCEAAGLCPLKRGAALSLLGAPVCEGQIAVLPPVSGLTPESLGRLSSFFTSEEFAAWVKALAAEERAALSRGVDIPGRKLVESKSLGNRKWADESAVVAAFSEYGTDIFDEKLKSPNQLTQTLVKLGVPRAEATEKVNALSRRDEIVSMKVVDASDPRPDAGSKDFSIFQD